MIEFVKGKIVEHKDNGSVKCKCLACKTIAMYGNDAICSWSLKPLNERGFRIYKASDLIIYCTECTMPMIIGPNTDYTEPTYYDFDNCDDPLNDIKNVIDMYKLDFTWNSYYENNHTFRDVNEDLKLYLTGKTVSGMKAREAELRKNN